MSARYSHLIFKTNSNSKYIFDNGTRTVLPINDILEDAIDQFVNVENEKYIHSLSEKYPEHYVRGTQKFLDRWYRKYGGFYQTKADHVKKYNRMTAFDRNDLEKEIYGGSMFQMILNVTENCNLRCKYCFYSEHYEHTRETNNKKMSLATGKRAIDYLFKIMDPVARRNPRKKVGITFYGGEPLINIDLVSRLVEYAKCKTPMPLQFNLTTNGLLLDDAAADFIVENKIFTGVSLDGSKENHDRNRVRPNGKGSFDVVFKNIKRMQARYPDYNDVVIMCVYDPATDIEENERFYEKNNLPVLFSVNSVFDGTETTTYYNQFTSEQKRIFNEKQKSLVDKYIRYKKEGKCASSYLRAFCASIWCSILRPRGMQPSSHVLPFTNTCLPGLKFSVRADGKMDICERVNGTMSIGNINDGLDIDAITKIVRNYNKALGTRCFSCPINMTCNLCFAVCMNDDRFEIDDVYCNSIIAEQESCYGHAYSILEENPAAFDEIAETYRPERILYS